MILGLESSCDESALALFEPGKGVLWERVLSQIGQHRPHGGVVPDIASREHLDGFPLLLEELKETLGERRPDSIAVTRGPGLAGCLAMGIAAAQALALAWNIPVRGINHLRGHIWSPFIPLHADCGQDFAEALIDALPHLGLLVSGGNTLLVSISRERQVTVLGETVDDAAGEALDKGAKLLGFPYPGGPEIERQALGGDPDAFSFPRAFAGGSQPRFSFSGLKTSLRYCIEKMDTTEVERHLPDLCASYQGAVVDALIAQLQKALESSAFRSIGLSGGVANNALLREAFAGVAARSGIPAWIAGRRHSGDNAAMIAFAAWMEPLRDGAETATPKIPLEPGLSVEVP